MLKLLEFLISKQYKAMVTKQYGTAVKSDI